MQDEPRSDDPYIALRGMNLASNPNRLDGLRFASREAERIYNESLIKPEGTPFLKPREAGDAPFTGEEL
jgi:hypothetical protein